ncbi:MAG TPA: response regulator [Myxococcales bacterium]
MAEEAPLLLCVDDHDGARYALTRTLQRAGFRTIEAASGIEALRKMEERPDLVVLDVQLPDINGFEVCQRIKADPLTAATPVLQISADFVDVEYRARGLELGADAYLAHPIEPPELIATIRALLRARRAEEKATATARDLQSTFDAISDPMCMLDREGRVVRCNQAMTRLLDMPVEELIGRVHESFLPAAGAGAEADTDPFRRMARSRKREVQDLQHGGRWLRLTCDPVLDERGELAGAVYIFSDFTERQRAVEEREQLLAREQAARAEAQAAVVALEAADHRKDEFLAMLAHELRNPLAAVTIGMHVLDEVGGKEPIAMQTRATVLRQAGVLTRLVDDLLDVSRITRGKVELRREPVPLRDVLEHAVATSRPLIDERRHELVQELAFEPLWVEADSTRLEQVVCNLINNAAKYTEPGGRILLRLRREGEYGVLSVRDTGIGIEPSMLSQVFELFAQADQSPARSRGGLGVGLTLVKQLVEMHGGTVCARSEGLQRGSEFEVRLPLLGEEAQALERRSANADPGRKRLLLVEDNPDIGETLRDLLQLLGHRVELVGDGLRAVQTALATQPDAALVDIGLPGIDGYEVARRVRASDEGKALVLVALTGYGRPEDRERALAAGFDAHLVKPVDPEELNEVLATLGGRRQASGQAPAAGGA